MLGLNGGLIGRQRSPFLNTGLWTLDEQQLSRKDPYWNNVSLLLHADGSDGSTTFTDSSQNNFASTAGGNAQLDTAQYKYGSASILCDGSGDFVRTPANAAFTFGLDNFTVEFWLRLDPSFSFAAATYLMTFGTGNYLSIQSSTFRWRTSGGTNLITGTLTPVVETWYHVALVRSGAGIKLFIDGTQDGSTYVAGTDFTNTQITFGASGAGANSLLGWIDDVRVTKGVARYTANFTAPAASFPDA
jgi:hypothetical protein